MIGETEQYVVLYDGEIYGPFNTAELARYFITNSCGGNGRVKLLRSAK